MKRPGCIVVIVAIVASAIVLERYRTADYRPTFARGAGALVAVRDSTQVAMAPDGKRLVDVTLASDSGLEARVRIRAPGQPTGERFPAAILVGGFDTGRRAAGIPSTTENLVVASVEYPFDGPRSLRGRDWLVHAPGLRRAFLEMPSALLLTAQYLYTRRDVDPDRVTIVGVSLGVPFAVAAGATDRRFAGAAFLHGGGELDDLFAYAYADRGLPWLVRLGGHAVGWLVAPLEPTKYAGEIAPRPVLIVNARDDEFIPRESVDALYRATRRPKRLVWIDTAHVRRSNEEVVDLLLGLTMKWMEEEELR